MDAIELACEQVHIDRAYEQLERLREKAKTLITGVLDRRSSSTHQGRYERDVTMHAGLRRLAALRLGSLPLVFGRIDRADGEHYHVGRVAVAGEDLTPLVVDWRAPVAEPFYRATPHAPLGLVRRRHFRARGPRLLGMDDERFGAGGGHADLPLVGEGALLEALSRSRTGRMTDIVETIQAEQDAVIRAPLEGVLVVQGGPGTGKTAVALHRAAYLLYTHRTRLERTGVLLVGPTPVFLRYIEDVLPGLGEQRVRLATVRDLVGWCVPTVTDPPQVARLKGEPRMAAALAKAGGGDSPLLTLRDLLSSPERLARAGDGLLSAEEQAALCRPGDWPGWSEADLPLLDELAALRPPRRARSRRPRLDQEERWYVERFIAEIAATHPMDEIMTRDLFKHVVETRLELEESTDDADEGTYGHVLVDEAQDLSPMQWRMLTRRCPSRSMTVVGDLGQATGPWAAQRWEDVTDLLNAHRTTVAELTINYRTPEEIMAFADAIRPPWLRPARPVRRAGAPPVIQQVGEDALPAAVAAAIADALAAVEGTVGVVAGDALLPHLAATDDADGRVTILGVRDAKGLEFDAVIVVEPAAIADETGLRALYVALTRATQRLTVIRTRPLPPELRRRVG
ncbi:MAG: HelD family protein [Egibacteraceae bacterium]